MTGWLLVVGAVAFAVAATVLSSTFDWPDILREPPEVVLPAFVAGGTSLVWTWFATAWTYAILLVPVLLLPAALGRRDDPVLRAATFVGAASVLLALIGFLRWVFVVPALAEAYVAGDPVTRAATAAAWTAQHQFGGALLGEHLGQLLAIGWSLTVSVLVLRTGMLARWVGWAGLVASVLYLFNQGDILATAVPGFPVFDLAGFVGSSLWALWVIALGVAVLRRPSGRRRSGADQTEPHRIHPRPEGREDRARPAVSVSTLQLRGIQPFARQPDGGEGQVEPGALRDEPYVAGEGERRPGASRHAVHGGQDRLGHGRDERDDRVVVVTHRRQR